MGHGTKVSGANKLVTAGFTKVSGVNKKITKGLTRVSGAQKVINFVTVEPVALSTFAEGDIVYIPENGVDTPFYVAKHNYESGLNGSGRTLLVRRYLYSKTMAINSSGVNVYASGETDTWLNADYKSLLPNTVQTLIGTTKFYYTPGNGNKTVTTLERSCFLLSYTEMKSHTSTTYNNIEGTTLPIASSLLVGLRENGSAASQWTRSPRTNGTTGFCVFMTDGSGSAFTASTATVVRPRPVFTLPSTTGFNPETNEIVA